MIYAFLIIIHVIISILMVLVILMQASKGKGLAGAFGGAGGMASQVLGSRGTATFLSKTTVYLSVFFMVNCILLSFLSGGATTPRSAVQDAMQNVGTETPAGNLPLVPGSMEGMDFSGDQTAAPETGTPAAADSGQ